MRRPVTYPFQFAALILFVLGATSVSAQGTSTPPASPGYVAISPPQPTSSGDKVEVIEVFSYGCIHCAQFQPYVDAWSKRVDKSAVQFTYLPAPFNPLFSLMGRGYYAAASLGLSEKTHQQVFDALFVNGKQVNNLATLADLYASIGVDRVAFMKAAQSFVVESQLRRAEDLIRVYGVDGTPSVIVAGKYRVTGESAGGHDKVFAVVDALVAKERRMTKTAPKMQ